MRITEILSEAFGRRYTSYHDELSSRDRDMERQWDQEKRDFKRQEHEAEWEQEKAYHARQREHDMGPWYLKIDGKILKTQGQPKVFDWKKGANNYALAILKNKPQLQGKIMLTKNPQDNEVSESATPGATMAANIGTVDAPQLSPGKARGKKSYTGSMSTGSGTKAPPQPKVNQPKNADGTAKNGLDMKGNIFGGPAIKR